MNYVSTVWGSMTWENFKLKLPGPRTLGAADCLRRAAESKLLSSAGQMRDPVQGSKRHVEAKWDRSDKARHRQGGRRVWGAQAPGM